jgi:hypothetical protein
LQGEWQNVFAKKDWNKRKTNYKLIYPEEIKNSIDLFITDPPFGIGKGDWDQIGEVTFFFH